MQLQEGVRDIKKRLELEILGKSGFLLEDIRKRLERISFRFPYLILILTHIEMCSHNKATVIFLEI